MSIISIKIMIINTVGLAIQTDGIVSVLLFYFKYITL